VPSNHSRNLSISFAEYEKIDQRSEYVLNGIEDAEAGARASARHSGGRAGDPRPEAGGLTRSRSDRQQR